MRSAGPTLMAACVVAAATFTCTALLSGAAAASTGDLAITPNPGTNVNAASVVTPRPCSAGATYVQTRLEGPGFADSSLDPARQGRGYNISSNSPFAPYEHTSSGGLIIPLLLTFQAAAEAQTPPAPLLGVHTLTTRCKELRPSGTVYDEFSVRIDFASPTKYVVVATGNAAAPSPGAATADVPASPISTAPSPTAAPSEPAASGSAAPSTSSSAPADSSAPAESSAASAAAPVSSAAAGPGSPALSAAGPAPSAVPATAPNAARKTSSGFLPRTGANILALIVVSVALIVGGAAAIKYARTRGYQSFGRTQ